MAWSISLTCATFCYLLWAQLSIAYYNMCLRRHRAARYGFSFSAYMLYLIYYSEGELRTAHYAICTGFMARRHDVARHEWPDGYREQLGYLGFFWWVMICCVVTIAVTAPRYRCTCWLRKKHV